MATALLLALLLAQQPPRLAPVVVPREWDSFPQADPSAAVGITPAVTEAVMRLHGRRGCRVPAVGGGWRAVRVEVAFLVAADGRILDVETRSSACALIQAHAAQVMRRAYDGRISPQGTHAPEWQRTQISFSWLD